MQQQPSRDSSPTLASLERVDAVCLRFEDEWKAGRRPRVEDFLAGAPGQLQDRLLTELLLLEWDCRRRAGEPIDPEEYARRFRARPRAVEEAWQLWREDPGRRGWTTARGGFTPDTAAAAEPAVFRLPGYEQVTRIGKGGMGEVYRAWATRLKRWVALKQVRVDQAAADQRARFRREAEALARLAHPRIVTVHDFVEHDGQAVLVMEHVAGGALEERLGGQALPPAEAARLVALLAWGVQAAHEAGVVHRDLKPANVLMDHPKAGDPGNVLAGYPKISDFGLAALAARPGSEPPGEGRPTLDGALLGTPAYMSPEQAAGRTREVGPATDVWALGVILYRCLTGKLPFEGDSLLDTLERIKTVQMRPLRELCPGVPADLEAICLACLRKAPDERPSAAELARRLEQALSRPEAPARERPNLRSRRWPVAAGAAAAVLAVGVWALLGKGNEEPPPKVQLRVLHFEARPDRDVPRGPIGANSMEALVGDRVVVQAELSPPGYCYVIGYNFDGKEQLLWPRNEKRADPTLPPPLLARVQCPPPAAEGEEQAALRLDDDPRGGVQAYVVVASRQQLSPFQQWKAGRSGQSPWLREPPGPGVWRCDGEALDTVQAGEKRVRATEVRLKGQPPLLRLSRWARGPGLTVEAVAFPVYRREK